MRRILKTGGIIIGALAFTTLGISASDTLQGASGSLVSMVFLHNEKASGCGEGAALVVSQGRQLCVDTFEASVGEACPVSDPKNIQETERNLQTQTCAPLSQAERKPWRFVNLSQAQRACAAAGKRLMTNEEWYRAALGTPLDSSSACYIRETATQVPRKTAETACRSANGMYDMVGNVWEWVDVSVENGQYNNRTLPAMGYIAQVDADGIALATQEQPDEIYGKDYFWHTTEGVRGMLRGGFYGSGDDGGLYALNASVELGFGSAGVGFRCVRDYVE